MNLAITKTNLPFFKTKPLVSVLLDHRLLSSLILTVSFVSVVYEGLEELTQKRSRKPSGQKRRR